MNEIESILPADKQHWLTLRAKNINSTDCAALFGLSSYSTEFELYHRLKDGHAVEIEENERMTIGTKLQDAIGSMIAEERGWKIRRMDEYLYHPHLRIGSSFDFEVTLPDGRIGTLEIKNVDGLVFRNQWTEDEAPPHIELQKQHQFALSGREIGFIGALVGGNHLVVIEREPDPVIITEIKKRAAAMWSAIAAGVEPKPDFSRDAELIAKLYGHSEPGQVYDARGDATAEALIRRYEALGKDAKAIETERSAIKSQMLMTIGHAEKVLGDGWSISAGTQGPVMIEAFERKGFRNFRVNFKKEK